MALQLTPTERMLIVEDELEKLRDEVLRLASQGVLPHAAQHELAGGDDYRISIQANGVRVQRQRELNFTTGFTLTNDTDNRRINIVATAVIVNPTNDEVWLFQQNGWLK